MNSTNSSYDQLYAEMETELVEIEKEALTPEMISYQSMMAVRPYLMQLKAGLVSNGFSSTEEEIHFFKKVKPKFHCLFIYYAKVTRLILSWPLPGKEVAEQFLHEEGQKLHYFFKKHSTLYEYYRSGATFLDNQFFTRQNTVGNPHLMADLDTQGIDVDPLFTTGYDLLVAKMLVNELYAKHLESEVAKLQYSVPQMYEQVTGKLTWTASKAALIELLYALQSTGVFNHGRVALNEVATFMEQVFHIKLGNYYRVFQEIRIRKKSRTQFLDEIKERLIQKMDYTDENPHI